MFPNFRNKHKEDSIITPQKYLEYQRNQGNSVPNKPPQGVLLCFSRRFMNHIHQYHGTVGVEGVFSRQFYFFSDSQRRLAVAGNFGTGAPAAAAILDELIAMGVKKFVFAGEAGSLQEDLGIGSIVVCDRAIRDEGTSHHYLPPSKYAEATPPITNRLVQALRKQEILHRVGTSWTVDAPYRETVSEVRKYQKEGVLTVDMEASALFAVGKYRGAQVGGLFTISDSLANLIWQPAFHRSEENWEILLATALDALSS